MRFLLFASIFILISSIAYAGIGSSRLAMPRVQNELYDLHRKIPVKKQVLPPRLGTQGYKPEKQPEIIQWHKANLPKNVIWLDEEHERFVIRQSFRERMMKFFYGEESEK